MRSLLLESKRAKHPFTLPREEGRQGMCGQKKLYAQRNGRATPESICRVFVDSHFQPANPYDEESHWRRAGGLPD